MKVQIEFDEKEPAEKYEATVILRRVEKEKPKRPDFSALDKENPWKDDEVV